MVFSCVGDDTIKIEDDCLQFHAWSFPCCLQRALRYGMALDARTTRVGSQQDLASAQLADHRSRRSTWLPAVRQSSSIGCASEVSAGRRKRAMGASSKPDHGQVRPTSSPASQPAFMDTHCHQIGRGNNSGWPTFSRAGQASAARLHSFPRRSCLPIATHSGSINKPASAHAIQIALQSISARSVTVPGQARKAIRRCPCATRCRVAANVPAVPSTSIHAKVPVFVGTTKGNEGKVVLDERQDAFVVEVGVGQDKTIHVTDRIISS